MTTKRNLRRNDIKQLIEKVKTLSPFELKDEFIKMHVTQIKTDFSDFEKFKYNFIR